MFIYIIEHIYIYFKQTFADVVKVTHPEKGRVYWIIQLGPTLSHESLKVENHFFFPAGVREKENEDRARVVEM